jgi:HCOMODA/2-hydroxy-3-carboxy-muconic semialdehyde decarboxylase
MHRPAFLLGLAATAALAVAPARAADSYASAVDDLVAANRILAQLNVVDGFGHISVRDPRDPSHYLLARSMAPALVTAADIQTYDLQSRPLDPNPKPSYFERFIHGAIYAARPDVMSVVHSHTESVIPFADTGVALRPMFHMASFLGSAGVPIFEIRDAGGPATDMLVGTQQLGDALARTLGSGNVALMRGHGMVVVGASIPEAVFRAYYTGEDARLEAEALRLGTPTYLNAAEAAHSTQTNAALVGRSWALWRRALTPS